MEENKNRRTVKFVAPFLVLLLLVVGILPLFNLGKPSGETVRFNPWFHGVVTAEESYHVEHPLALVDSELGLTHLFNLSVYNDDQFIIHSDIIYKGVSASHTYTFSCIVHFAFPPLQVSNGTVVTYYGDFKHVYQEGSLYRNIGGWWVQVGHFQREFISDWYVQSYLTENSAALSETREEYLGSWLDSHGGSFGMPSDIGRPRSGSVPLNVKRVDVFGQQDMSLTFEYTPKLHHSFYYTQPEPNLYVAFYAGRVFDINMHQYADTE
ncbi:MAG: hypothetical protein GWO20_05465 [Candidatus Korarchaeota archaeon]|nr:hypothetical protein [Candidatus Korarchaeota archaeon]NIU85251.1 hypothetical protein [Candidatus Thorarchaeota archaeon]NIW15341.1 hypothetical protein [Candidatus Thorarchaeota archaeon]NIW53301.1 hypothetical protein [Candidatus Korarchaeota archaeon]